MQNITFFGTAVVAAVVALANPVRADDQKPADFAVTTCLDSIGDLSKVDAIAKEQNWQAKSEKERSSDFQIKSQWDVAREGQRFAVLTGTGTVKGLGASNVCMVMFAEPREMAQDFVRRISASVSLKVFAELKLPVGRMDMHEVEKNDGKKTILQVMSNNDGRVFVASVIGAQ